MSKCCKKGCSSKPQSQSCGCDGERIRVNNFETAATSDRRGCACADSRPKPCSSCRPKPCPVPYRPEPNRSCCEEECREEFKHCMRQCRKDDCRDDCECERPACDERCDRERTVCHEDHACNTQSREDGRFERNRPCFEEECDERNRPCCEDDCCERRQSCRADDFYDDEFGCCCGYDEEPYDYNDQLFRDQPIGMAYVPRQRWKCPMKREEGFEKGTIFHDLYKPFKGGNC